MRPRRAPLSAFLLTRRSLASRLIFGAAAIGLGNSAQAVPAHPMAVDPDLRDAALRGLALADRRGDPVAAGAADAALARLAETDPEGALLARLYRRLDVRPSAYWADDAPQAEARDLAVLHGAIAASRPVWFGYTDLNDRTSERTVLPLALVHPPQGVKLLAWCLSAEGYRQFFVREMRELTLGTKDFSARRMALLQGLVEKEGA